jgi:putative oxidoreductase
MLNKYEKQLYALFRIMLGFLFLWHGSQKLFDFPPMHAGMVVPFYIIAIGGTIEFFGGLLICLGLWTPWAAFIASGQMAFAYWSVHGTRAILPVVNMGELAVVYCFAFLFISAYGSGIWSIDAILKGKKLKGDG